MSNCVDTAASCCQSMLPSRPVDPIVTPSNDVELSATSLSDVEPLIVVDVVRVVVVADAVDAPTTPATMLATPTHMATKAPENL